MTTTQTDNQDRIAQLRGDYERRQAEIREITEGRQAVDLTDEEVSRIETLDEECDFLSRRIKALTIAGNRLAESDPHDEPHRRTQAMVPDADRDRRQSQALRRDPTMGFASMGDFALAVRSCCTPHLTPDERLVRAAPTSFSNTEAGTEGGYLVPPEFNSQVMEYISGDNSIYALCEKTPVSHELLWPTDEDAPWSTSGPQAYWEGEGDPLTQSKLNVRRARIGLNKLTVLCPVTEELMRDAPQMGAYITSVISRRMRWKVDYAIMQGTGAGQMLGILHAPCLKTVAKESGQTADTINSTNILKMWSAMFGEFRGRATWVYNQDCETQLMTMVVAGSSSDVPVYLPSGGGYGAFAGRPQTTIMGRPAITHQACETLGDEGDIFFCDFSQYLIGQQSAGPELATSMHLYFDYNMMAVRAIWRLCGMPKWSQTISARDGSATYSPFVDLAVRS